MGLFDAIAGQVVGAISNAGGDAHPGVLGEIGSLINNTGGLSGLVSSFQEKGLGELVSSWVGKGQNLPISAEQIQSVLGSGQLEAMAEKLGLNPGEVSGHLAQLLPQVVDKLTPNGEVPQGDALGNVANLVKGLFG